MTIKVPSPTQCPCGKSGNDSEVIKTWIWVNMPNDGVWCCSLLCAKKAIEAKMHWQPTDEERQAMRE